MQNCVQKERKVVMLKLCPICDRYMNSKIKYTCGYSLIIYECLCGYSSEKSSYYTTDHTTGADDFTSWYPKTNNRSI